MKITMLLHSNFAFRYLQCFNLLCKSNTIKRYHHYPTLEDLSSQPKKIAIVTSVMGLNGRFFLRFEFEFMDSKNRFTLKIVGRDFFLGLRTFSNVNVLHKGVQLQDWVFRLGFRSNERTWLISNLHNTLKLSNLTRLKAKTWFVLHW